MKNILKYFIPCLFVALAFTSCYDTMDDKRDIDAQHESAFATPVISSASATAPAYNEVAVTVSVEDKNNVAEQGIQLSTSEAFTTDDYIANEGVDESYTISVGNLSELTTYYYRAYAVGKNGGMVYGSTQSITTPEAPATPLEGTYTAQEYAYKNGSWGKSGDPYKITIAFEEGSTEVVNVTNIWDAGTTVQGVYDAETHVITVPNQQLIYTDDTYGPLLLMGMNDAMTAYADVTFTFTPRGGAMKSSIWACLITTGAYAGYFYNYNTYLDMQHD